MTAKVAISYGSGEATMSGDRKCCIFSEPRFLENESVVSDSGLAGQAARQAGSQGGGLAGRQEQAGSQAARRASRKVARQAGWQAGRQPGRQGGRQAAGRKAHRQAGRQAGMFCPRERGAPSCSHLESFWRDGCPGRRGTPSCPHLGPFCFRCGLPPEGEGYLICARIGWFYGGAGK